MNKFAIVATLVAGLAAQSAAYAGYSYPSTVSVYSSSSGGSASGAVRAARYSADSVQYIGCAMASDAVSSAYVSCFARSNTGSYLYCLLYEHTVARSSHRSELSE